MHMPGKTKTKTNETKQWDIFGPTLDHIAKYLLFPDGSPDGSPDGNQGVGAQTRAFEGDGCKQGKQGGMSGEV